MRKPLIYLFTLLFLCIFTPCAFSNDASTDIQVDPLQATSTTNGISPKASDEITSQDALKAIQALNYIVVSLSHIINYNDKIVLDQEYNNIISKLDLSKIPDRQLKDLYQELLELLIKSKISALDREYIQLKYEKNVDKALQASIKQAAQGIHFTANPYTTLSSGILSAGSLYFNYRDQIESYKETKEEQIFVLKKNTIREIGDFQINLLGDSWELLKIYKAFIKKDWRLTQNIIENYSLVLKEKDPETRLRRLERIENHFEMYPPYWYYRGRTAMELNDSKEAEKCFDYFEKIYIPFNLQDPYVASLAMCRIVLLSEKNPPDRDRIFDYLKILIKNSEDSDWNNFVFAALQYDQMGYVKESKEMILRNLDNGYNQFLSNSETACLLLKNIIKDPNGTQHKESIKDILKSNTINNYDLLYLYGEIPNDILFNKINDELKQIQLLSSYKNSWNPTKKDSLMLVLPPSWYAENIDCEIVINDGNKETKHAYKKIKLIELEPQNGKRYLGIIYPDVISIKKAAKGGAPITVIAKLKREKFMFDKTIKRTYDINIYFNSIAFPDKEHISSLEKIKSKIPFADKTLNKNNYHFIKNKITVNKDVYFYNANDKKKNN